MPQTRFWMAMESEKTSMLPPNNSLERGSMTPPKTERTPNANASTMPPASMMTIVS